MSEIEKKEEMSKEELVYVLQLMLNCRDYKDQLNKLSKPCLFRLFDDMKDRGNRFANLEDDKRKLEKEITKLRGQVQTLAVRNDTLTRNMKHDFYKKKKGVKNDK